MQGEDRLDIKCLCYDVRRLRVEERGGQKSAEHADAPLEWCGIYARRGPIWETLAVSQASQVDPRRKAGRGKKRKNTMAIFYNEPLPATAMALYC